MSETLTETGVPDFDPTSDLPVGTSPRTVRRSLRMSALAAVVNVPLMIILLPIALGHLSVAAYGVYATLASLFAMATLAESGISTDITKRVADAYGRSDDDGIDQAVHEGVSILVMIAGGLLLLGICASQIVPPLVFPHLQHDLRAQLPWLIIAITAVVAASFVIGGYFSVLKGLQRSDATTWGDLSSVVTLTVVTALAVTHDCGLWSFVYGQMAGLTCAALVQTRFLRRLRPSLRFRLKAVPRDRARTYLGVSTVVIVASLAAIFDFQFDKLLLARFTGAQAAGSYQIGSTLAVQGRAVALLPIGMLVAGTAELRTASSERLDRLQRGLTQLNVLVAALILGGVVVFARPFVALWLNPSYFQAARAAELLAVALIINVLSAPWYMSCLGHGDNRPPLFSALVNLSVNAVASTALVVAIGFNGSLYGSIIGNLAGSVTLWWLVRRGEDHVSLMSMLPEVALAICISAPFAVVFHGWKCSWVELAGGGVLYAACLGLAFLLLRRLPARFTRSDGRLRVVAEF